MTPSLQIVILSPSGVRPDVQWSLPTANLRQIASDEPERQVASGGQAPDLVVLAGYPADNRLLNAIEVIAARMPAGGIAVVSGMPEPDFLMRLMRLGVREVWPDLRQTHVEACVRRLTERRPEAPSGALGACQVSGFLSAKGGDGGSFVAANLAAALGQGSDGRILLIDLALPFGDIAMFLPAFKSEYDLADFCEDTGRLDRELVELMAPEIVRGVRFIPSLGNFDRMAAINPQQLERLIRRLAAFFDRIVVDLGSGLSPVAVNMMGLIDRLVVVSTPAVPSLRRTSQVLQLWERLERDPSMLEVVVNRTSRRWDLPADKFEKTLGRPIDRQLPNQPEVANESLISAMPVGDFAPRSHLATVFRDWAASLTGATRPTKEEPLWRRLMTR